jgi:hypothetical protein
MSRGRRDVVSYHKWMTSHNFFDFGVSSSTFTSGSIASEGRFAIEIYKCRLAKKPPPIKRKN